MVRNKAIEGAVIKHLFKMAQNIGFRVHILLIKSYLDGWHSFFALNLARTFHEPTASSQTTSKLKLANCE